MNVQLKKIKTFEGHDGLGMSCDIWINGIKCIHAFDSANGGGNEYNGYTYDNPKGEQVKQNILMFEDHIKNLPQRETKLGGVSIKVSVDMDIYVEDLLNQMEEKKVQKKMDKLMSTAILLGVPNGNKYAYMNYKKPLSDIPVVMLQNSLNSIVAKHCKGNIVILNTNLEALGLTVSYS